jgi:hypothetical protein
MDTQTVKSIFDGPYRQGVRIDKEYHSWTEAERKEGGGGCHALRGGPIDAEYGGSGGGGGGVQCQGR